MMSRFCLICVMLFGMLSAIIANQPVSLVVVDAESGQPVAAAIVVIEKLGIHAYSDELGNVSFPKLQAGKYQVEVIRLGYATAQLSTKIGYREQQPQQISIAPRPVQLEDIVVSASPISLMEQTNVYEDIISRENPKDVGEFLKYRQGFAAIRRGGYAIDPVMRGFKYEQLNIQFDGGTKISHACPNRMDPVTTHVQAQNLEKIEIIKGPYAVRYGQTLGGVVNLVTKRPEYSQQLALDGQLESRYESNAGQSAHASVSGVNRNFDFYASAGTRDFQNYEAGDGTEIPSSFRVNDYAVRSGYNPSDRWRIQGAFRQSFARDVLHPGVAMDTEKDNSTLWSLDFSGRDLNGFARAINFKVFGSQADHIMHNRRRPNATMVAAVSDVQSRMVGGRLEATLQPALKTMIYIGFDGELSDKSGDRTRLVSMNPCTGMMMNPPVNFVDAVWQDAYRRQAGVFAELRQSLGERLIVVAGLRGDRVVSLAETPAVQFIELYGNPGEDSDEMLSASLSLNYQFRPRLSMQLSAGRGVRSPNMTERYINHLSIGPDPYEYVGNPYLRPEVNHQVDVTLRYGGEDLQLGINVFYSRINNQILAAVDPGISRLYMPCMMPENARRFQNISRARQAGFEFDFNRHLVSNLWMKGGAAYTRADNFDWDEPLPEIPPLQGLLGLVYAPSSTRWWTEFSGRFVADQERVSAAFDEQRTAGFAVFDWRGELRIHSQLRLSLGVLNVFNRSYREHLNRVYRNTGESGILLEPGRNIQVSVKLNR